MYQEGIFFNGGMNTDDEDRLVPNGDYRSAFFSRNYGNGISSEGALQSMTGNLLQENTNLAAGVNIIIGSCEDIESKALILFVWNEYNDHSIWRYTVEDAQYELILQDALLNFKKENKIYHAAVVNNLLYWTDNYFAQYEGNDFNPPRKINIAKAIRYTQSGGTSPEGYSEITFNNLDWIKHPPLFSPDTEYFTDTTETANNLKNKLFQFRYQYVYDDNEESAWSPISQLTLPNYSEYISQTVNINPHADNTIRLDINTGSSIARLIRVAYRIGNTGEFFLYNEYDKNQLGWSDYSVETISFKNETLGPAISNSERNYDLVPQIAKTIEYLPSNEFAIGNYREGYDKIEINEGDISFNQTRLVLNKINSFTRPTAVFWNLKTTSGPRPQVISFYAHTDSPSLFFKYKIAEGDVLILQLKEFTTGFITGSINKILPTIYYTVPFISGTSDLDYMNKLCIDLSNYLDSIGIPSSVSPSGTYTINSVNITWPTVRIDSGTIFPVSNTSYTWFNFTQSQLSVSNSTNYTQNITILRKNESTRTFKTGSTHEFAIQYYDRANRDGTVQLIPAGSVYVPFNTDLSTSDLNYPSELNRSPYSTSLSMSINSNFAPPIWATNYQVLYRPSTNIINFQQRSVNTILFNPDNTITLLLDNYYKSNFVGASINQTPSQGDFVRFVRKRALFNKEKKLIGVEEANNEFLLFNHLGGGNYSVLLSPYYNSVYDPLGIFSSGVFIAPSTGTYTLRANLLLTLNFPVGYFPTSVNAFLVTSSTAVGSDVFDTYSNSNITQSQITINIEGEVVVPLTAGDDIEILFTLVLTGTPFPSLLNATLINSAFSVMLGQVSYGDYNYFPEYVTSENSNNLELNVLSYNPAGANTSESITVNYFDASILGDYLSYNGTNTDRGFALGGFQIEIYTPKKENENDPWHEVGIEFPIIDAHTADRSHGGDENQIYGVQDGFVNLNCGDVYIRQRLMSTGYKYTGGVANISDANDNVAAWFCEDPHYSDFYISNWKNKGRLGLFSPFAKQQHLKASIYHTNALIDNTQINGLSRIEFFNNVVLKDEHGGINKLMQIGDTLKAFQDKKISSVYIQKAFALNGDGTNNVILSDKTFAGIRPHDDDYGCIHPGSVSKVENNVFFYDFYNAAVVQATQGGLINICEGEYKFSIGIEDFTNDIRSYEQDSGNKANVVSHINRSNGEYALFYGSNLNEIPNSITFTGFDITPENQITFAGNVVNSFPPGTVFIITGANDPENNGTYTVINSVYSAGKNATSIFISETFASEEIRSEGTITVLPTANIFGESVTYSFNRKRWSSYMSHPVIWATQFGNRAYTSGGTNTLNIGKLFEEEKGTEELTFFDQPYIQQVEFLFNANPTIIKRFLTFMTQSNMPFNEVNITIPATNQYPSGMVSSILEANFRNQESYYVSKYFRDTLDPNTFMANGLKRLNGRELRGYVLRHYMFNNVTTNKMILFSANVNFVPSEPMMQ